MLIQTEVLTIAGPCSRVLMEQLGPRFAAYVGATYNQHPLLTLASIQPVTPAAAEPLADRRLIWQHGALRAATRPSVLVVELNPRVLSTWGVLLMRRARGKRTLVCWGHAWPDAGRRSRIALARRVMRSLASGVIVYSAEEAAALAAEQPTERIFVAPNALYREDRLVPAGDSGVATPGHFLYVGRLVDARRPHLPPRAFARARTGSPGHGARVRGRQPLQASPPDRRAESGADGPRPRQGARPAAVLRGLYAGAIASVHPGEVGLSVTQSGRPACR
ncbi:MAG: hypothetical protein R3C32_06260 [Chloroflexota bacterium]